MDEELQEVARELAARLFALQAALTAVIRTHPHPEALAEALSFAEDAGLSNMQYLPWPESTIAVYRTTVQSLRVHIPPR